jgi:hypothetical protein
MICKAIRIDRMQTLGTLFAGQHRPRCRSFLIALPSTSSNGSADKNTAVDENPR